MLSHLLISFRRKVSPGRVHGTTLHTRDRSRGSFKAKSRDGDRMRVEIDLDWLLLACVNSSARSVELFLMEDMVQR